MLARLCSFARCLARVLGGLHHIVIRQSCVLNWPWGAGAEAEGEEEEGHFRQPQVRGMGLCIANHFLLMH
jgi:hypothetical protein